MTLFTFLPVLVCGGMMVVCMFLMGGLGRRRGSSSSSSDTESNLRSEVADLRDQVARLTEARDSAQASPDATRG